MPPRIARIARRTRIAPTTILAGLATLAGLVAGCGPRPTPPWHQEAGYRWRNLDVSGKSVGFTALDAGRTGINFENTVSEKSLLGNRVLAQGAGVALGDVDGDGLVDVFLARTEGCSALYRNLGNWHFEDITKAAGVGACGRHATGATFADVDGNGTLDLILLATTGPNAIFLNDGKGHFTEHRDLGLDTTGRGGTTVTLADIDGSGRLAMFVANYKAYAVDDTIPPQERAYDQMVRKLSPDRYEVIPKHRRDYKLVNRPDMGGLRLTQRAEPNELYVNDGHGHFSPVPLASPAFRDVAGAPLREAPESFALTAKFVDLNGDGVPDLYVANDFEDTDELWFNDGHGNFRRAGWTSQRQMSNADMGFDVADINGDGTPDLFCVDMLANDSHRLKTQMPTHTPLPKKPGDLASQLQQQRNTLFLNRGDGTFAEIGQYAGVTASGWSWTTMFLDVDLDGRPDILVGSGHLWDIMDADVQERVARLQDNPDWRALRWQFPPLKLKNVAWRNRGDLTFEDVSTTWRFGTEEGISHAMAAADLDGDGDLDVVVNRLGAPALVLRNDAPAARVAVRLSAEAPNTRAVGARLQLRAGTLPLQSREITAGGLYLSHSDYLASFAMGTADSATLDIQWRDGRRTTMTVRANRLYEITSATAAVATLATESAAERAPAPVPAPPLFEDVSPQLGGHTHTENTFDDWGRQFLLPSGLSQLGPGVAWVDLDRDGYEDLIVGTGKGGRLAVFRNQKGRLAPDRSTRPVAQADLTGLVG
ncbi:MAG TPA: CRTAC1 family protein, partial [Gemmatimonadaceae bacterium]